MIKQCHQKLSESLFKYIKSNIRHVDGAFAYGSILYGNMSDNLSKNDKEIDLILLSNNLDLFHETNSKEYPQLYSNLLRKPKIINNLHSNYFEGLILYKSGIKADIESFENVTLKIGVSSYSSVSDDLINWENTFIPGRLHKPIIPIMIDSKLKFRIYENRKNAFILSILCSGQKQLLKDIIERLYGFSYIGDYRISLGVDKNKAKEIYHYLSEESETIYKNLIDDLKLRTNKEGDEIQLEDSKKIYLYNKLSENIKREIRTAAPKFYDYEGWDIIVKDLIEYNNKKNQTRQYIFNILNNKPTRIFNYALRKIQKSFGIK